MSNINAIPVGQFVTIVFNCLAGIIVKSTNLFIVCLGKL